MYNGFQWILLWFVDEYVGHDTPIAPCKGIQDGLGFWIPRRRIPDSRYLSLCQWNLDSGFLALYSGFQSPGFRIPQAKLFRIPIPQAKISQIQESGFPFTGLHQSGFARLTEWPKRFRWRVITHLVVKRFLITKNKAKIYQVENRVTFILQCFKRGKSYVQVHQLKLTPPSLKVFQDSMVVTAIRGFFPFQASSFTLSLM